MIYMQQVVSDVRDLQTSPDVGGVFHGISPDLPDLDDAVAGGRLPLHQLQSVAWMPHDVTHWKIGKFGHRFPM